MDLQQPCGIARNQVNLEVDRAMCSERGERRHLQGMRNHQDRKRLVVDVVDGERNPVEREPRLSGEAIAQVFMAGNHTDNTPRLNDFKVPLLVINGEFDNSLPAGARTASLVPGAVHKILPGTGHACCLEDPAGFDQLVIAFLSSRNLMPKL